MVVACGWGDLGWVKTNKPWWPWGCAIAFSLFLVRLREIKVRDLEVLSSGCEVLRLFSTFSNTNR